MTKKIRWITKRKLDNEEGKWIMKKKSSIEIITQKTRKQI
jgi:hypothetical protein